MKGCHQHAQALVLYRCGELSGRDSAALEAHLHACEKCREALDDVRLLQEAFATQPHFEPDEHTLRVLRRAVRENVQSLSAAPARWWPPWSALLRPAPALRLTVAVLLVAVGFLLGRQSAPPASHERSSLQELLTAAGSIEAPDGAVNPLLAGINRLKFDAQTGAVEIYYNTVNDIYLRGDVQDAALHPLLHQALFEEGNAGVRLDAVDALGALAAQQEALDPALAEVLVSVLQHDVNLGIRLRALRALKPVVQQEAVRQAFLTVLLSDTTTALRIEVFRALTDGRLQAEQLAGFLAAARRDTNAYIRIRAEEIIRQYQAAPAVELGWPQPLELLEE